MFGGGGGGGGGEGGNWSLELGKYKKNPIYMKHHMNQKLLE